MKVVYILFWMFVCIEVNNLNILNIYVIILYLLKNCLMGFYFKYYYNVMGISLLYKINNFIYVYVLIKNRNV